ncbi:hypothetical protein [Arcticibacter sp. MXS-1]|uniref:hypothetical protein n=1 Tax=Arcticibacter sp. MXS-1 TaxID=3341726 RepID=UPI0035A88247
MKTPGMNRFLLDKLPDLYFIVVALYLFGSFGLWPVVVLLPLLLHLIFNSKVAVLCSIVLVSICSAYFAWSFLLTFVSFAGFRENPYTYSVGAPFVFTNLLMCALLAGQLWNRDEGNDAP